MILRAFQETDLDQIKIIHEKFYKEEFDLPDFTKNFICAFTVIQNDKVIMAGGVRTLAEVVLVTDKEAPLRKRRDAFLQVLDASAYFAGRTNHTQLHAFVQDRNWREILNKVGFKPCNGNALYLNLRGNHGQR